MNKVFQTVKLSGIVKPGEIYILSQDKKKLGSRDISSLYTIRSEEEAVAALEMHVHLICDGLFELQTFLGVQKVSDDLHVIKLLCHNKLFAVNMPVRYFLHRLISFQEELAVNSVIYGIE